MAVAFAKATTVQQGTDSEPVEEVINFALNM
jgi:hypothetical protein